MGKKLKVLSFASLAFISLAGIVLSTVSWFVAAVTTPKYHLTGKSAGAYFAYGDGSEEHPYGISILVIYITYLGSNTWVNLPTNSIIL